MLLASVNEIALLIAGTDDRTVARSAAAAVDEILQRLLTPPRVS